MIINVFNITIRSFVFMLVIGIVLSRLIINFFPLKIIILIQIFYK
jgi:hypothetical protein